MLAQWQSLNAKAYYIPWIAILLISALFIFIEDRTILDPTKHDSGFYTSEGAAEVIASSTEEGSMPRRVGLVMLALFGGYCLWRPITNSFKINGVLGLLLIIFFFWAAASIFWAQDPSLTVRRVSILAMLWLGSLGFACRYSLEDTLWLAFIGSLLLLVLGLAGEVATGSFKFYAADYRFSGGLHPNHQGWTCSLLLLTSVLLGGKNARNRSFFILTGLLALSLLVLTKSRIATGSTILMLLLYWYFTSPQRNKLISVLLAISFACLAFILLQNNLADYTQTSLSMGRTDYSKVSDLSGRLPLWEELLKYASRRFVTGYGFDAFWTPDHILAVSEQMEWGVPGAHSGVLEMVLGIGIIGALLFLAILFTTLKKLITHWHDTHDRLYLFSTLILIYFFSVMLAEEIFTSSSFPGFIVTIIIMNFAFTTPQPCADTETLAQEYVLARD